ncbi:TPA: SH3 domain-containing protein [Clostridium botulinum]|nr:SH3 domain-containing protein [Clostridium botulinum]
MKFTGICKRSFSTGIICTPSGGNVRENKLTSSRILGVLDNDAKFNLYRKEGDWIHIYYSPNGEYVYRKYIRY